MLHLLCQNKKKKKKDDATSLDVFCSCNCASHAAVGRTELLNALKFHYRKMIGL